MLKANFIPFLLIFCSFTLHHCKTQSISNDPKTPISQNKVVNIQEFNVYPNNLTTETDEIKYNKWLNIKKAFEYCIENKYDLYFPKGVYDVGARNFPFRQPEGKGNLMKDCRSITIFGDGENTLLKTTSELGADVLQLNMVKNLTVKNFSITAGLTSAKRAGSNGISITNGFDNITLNHIYIYNLPGIDKGNYIDGGKGLTLQFDPNIKSIKGSLNATNIKVKNCAYGFRFDGATLSDLLKGDINIKLQIEADRTFQGFSMSFGVPVENVDLNSKFKMEVDATLTNSQQYVSFTRVIGGNYRFILDKTIPNENINKDISGKVWYKADQIKYAFLSNYSKYTNTSIKGNVGNVDTKIWMGAVGSVIEPFNLKNKTENNVFIFDISGKSSDEDFKVIEYQGNSIDNTKMDVTSETLQKKLFFEKIKNNNNSLFIK